MFRVIGFILYYISDYLIILSDLPGVDRKFFLLKSFKPYKLVYNTAVNQVLTCERKSNVVTSHVAW